MSRNLKKFANRKFVNTIDIVLLRRLLERHAHGLPSFDFAAFDVPSAARETVAALFLGPETELPEGLVVDVHHLADLGSAAGLDVLLAEARRRGLDFVASDADEARQDPKHVALAAYLDHRDVFEAAADRMASMRFSTIAELIGKDIGLAPRRDAEALDRFRLAAASIYSANLLGDLCRVTCYEDGDEVALVVTHGKPVVSAPVIENGRERTTCWRPVAQARLGYVHGEGRLKLGGVSRTLRARLADAFGVELLGRPGQFAGGEARNLYTLAPLERDWPQVRLTHAFEPAIAKVRVAAVQIDRVVRDMLHAPRPMWSVTVAAPQGCAFASLREMRDDLDFRGGWRLGMVRLELEFRCARGRTPRVIVEIRPNAVAHFRRNRFEGYVLDFLHRNGLRHVRDAPEAAVAAE
jgi:hypothetical protein